jgi:hypothetical protein
MQWIALGYFNQIHCSCGKNNINIGHSRLTRFRDTQNDMGMTNRVSTINIPGMCDVTRGPPDDLLRTMTPNKN